MSTGIYHRPIEDRRREPCARGHSRHDAYVRIGTCGKPYLRCRTCSRAAVNACRRRMRALREVSGER
jgi:hypothetical protein